MAAHAIASTQLKLQSKPLSLLLSLVLPRCYSLSLSLPLSLLLSVALTRGLTQVFLTRGLFHSLSLSLTVSCSPSCDGSFSLTPLPRLSLSCCPFLTCCLSHSHKAAIRTVLSKAYGSRNRLGSFQLSNGSVIVSRNKRGGGTCRISRYTSPPTCQAWAVKP